MLKRNHRISLLNDPSDCVWEDENAKTVSFFCNTKPVLIGPELIKDLKKIARQRKVQTVRMCLHEGPEAIQHDMIILAHRGVYARPHKHLKKEDVYHLMEGRMAVVLFDIDGMLTNTEILCSHEIYRIGWSVYHAVVPLTSEVIYHENKLGPFIGESDAVYPSWAPDGSDAAAAENYTQELLSQLEGGL